MRRGRKPGSPNSNTPGDASRREELLRTAARLFVDKGFEATTTRDIADALMVHGRAAGAACVIEAEQLCLLLGEDRRGDERVVTQAFAGAFEQSEQARNEFLRAIEGRRS